MSSTNISLIQSLSSFFTIFSSTLITSYADVLLKAGYTDGKEIWMGFCFLLSSLAFLANALPELNLFTLPESTAFYFYMTLKIFEAVFQTTLHHMSKAIALDFLQAENNNDGYGQERLYASISWGLFNCIVGYSIDQFGSTKILYYSKFASSVIFFVVLYFFCREKPSNNHKCSNNERSPREVESRVDNRGLFAVLFSSTASAVFVGLFSLVNSGKAIVSNQAFPFFQKVFGSTNLTCGLSVTVSIIFEIPIMWCSGSLLKMIGPQGLLACGSICYCIRVLGYTLISNGGLALMALETLHGVTFGFSDTAATAFVNTAAPSEVQQDAQVFFHTLVKIVTIIISTIGGVVVDKYGAVILFRGAAATMASFLCLFLMCTFWPKRAELEREKTD